MKLLEKQFFSPDNLRLSTAAFQGGRKYMEDEFSVVHYSPSQLDGKENARPSILKPFIYLGIFDGHGGDMASKYSRDNLCNNIIRQHDFWSDNDDDVCRAIHNGFIDTQRQMQDQVAYWPKTALGHMSTAGTTASIIFIMNGKYYTGHVGDSRIILARENKSNKTWESFPLTRDHKPSAPEEKERIEKAGGKVINKSGVSRVVWKRLKYSANPSPQATPSPGDFDVIPFLAVARALGDLWSYNKKRDLFVVSPEPDVNCVPISPTDTCLILATDGLWNMVPNQAAVNHIRAFEKENTDDTQYSSWDCSVGEVSHSAYLVEQCMKKWARTKYRADNITVLTVMLDIDRTKMKTEDCGQRSKVDDEGNLFCPAMIGKMLNDHSDEYVSESELDSDSGSEYELRSRRINRRDHHLGLDSLSKLKLSTDPDIVDMMDDIVHNVCASLHFSKSDYDQSLSHDAIRNGLSEVDKAHNHDNDNSNNSSITNHHNHHNNNGHNTNGNSKKTEDSSPADIENNVKNNNNNSQNTPQRNGNGFEQHPEQQAVNGVNHKRKRASSEDSHEPERDDILLHPSSEKKLKLNVPVFTNSQMEEIQFANVVSSDGFQGYQDSFTDTITLDRAIFGVDRL